MEQTILPRIPDLISKTWNFVCGNWLELLFLMGLPIGLQELYAYLNPIVISLIGKNDIPLLLLYSAASILIAFILPLFSFYNLAVGIKYIGNSLDGIKSLSKAYIETFRYIFQFIWAAILLDLCFFGASIFFIIPGIVVFVYLQGVLFLVMEGKYKGLRAISASFQLIKGRWWKVFGRIFFMMVSNIILSVVTIFVFVGIAYVFEHSNNSFFSFISGHEGIIVMAFLLSSWIYSAFSMPYLYILYRSLLKIGAGVLTETELQKSRGFFMGLSIWGLVSGFLMFILFCTVIIASAFLAARQKYDTLGNGLSASSSPYAVMNGFDALPGNMLIYIDPVYGYSMNYPKNWDVTSDNGSTNSMFFIAPAEQAAEKGWGLRGSVVINILGSSSSFTPEQIDQVFKDGVIGEANRTNDQWTILSRKTIAFQGVSAWEYTSTKLRTFDDGNTYIKQKNQDIVFTKNNLIYDVAYKAGLDNFDILLPTATSMIDSFKISEKSLP